MSLLNDIDNPNELEIQNELRLLAKEAEGSFSVTKEHGITTTTYENDNGARVRLFERESDDSPYLKITYPYEDDPEFDEVGNYNLDTIESIQIQHNPIEIHLNTVDGEFAEWNL